MPAWSLGSAGLSLSAASSSFLAMKICRKSSTSRWVKLSSAISLLMRSSSACSCSVSSILESCTKVQNSISPLGLTSLMPASTALSRATSSFFMSSDCSFRDFGSQPKVVRMPISSWLSITPLLSLSYLSKTCLSSAIFSSLKPAFLRSLATNSARQESTSFTNSSKSRPAEDAGCGAVPGGSWFKDLNAFGRRAKGRKAASLFSLNTLWIAPSSSSRWRRMSFRYSRKSRQLLPFSSTWLTKMWIWSRVSL
mmetsp:Transcript_13022/g.29652  ORF Transcript_13022/g.29652 Transcript_13022/m.29652 type:complete len:252 (-) Transcript_13022:435-1190(-)